MKAARIHRFGAPDVVVVEEVPRPAPAAGELLIMVAASGVGPWDALIREGKSKVSPPPPLTLGSDLSGVVEEAGGNCFGDHSGLMLAARITLPHFSVSEARSLPNSAG